MNGTNFLAIAAGIFMNSILIWKLSEHRHHWRRWIMRRSEFILDGALVCYCFMAITEFDGFGVVDVITLAVTLALPIALLSVVFTTRIFNFIFASSKSDRAR